ncbi:hypothetical protein BDY19DRAFT_903652 [Irpex rosettiformis]|uniref:Uncharacterized protein n=1 Tax=Irpex rosettiformis TaxID=378272 RepID=A0ACB8UCA5_9APHY|nr:hypothetical protein BDY19DRAFT_903652 [Irpex rosettiformis]
MVLWGQCHPRQLGLLKDGDGSIREERIVRDPFEYSTSPAFSRILLQINSSESIPYYPEMERVPSGYVEVVTLETYLQTALSLYEYFLTLFLERNLIWRRQISMVSALFIANRYANIVVNILHVIKPVIWEEYGPDAENRACSVISWFEIGGQYLIYIALFVFSAIRTHAIWNHNKRILIVVSVLGSIYPSFGLLTAACSTRTLPKVLLTNQGIYSYLAISSTIAMELVVIILTWMKTVPTLRTFRRSNANFTPNVTYILYRDGTLSFLLIFMLSTISLLSSVWAPFLYVTMLSDWQDHIRRTDDVDRSFCCTTELSQIQFDGAASQYVS